MDVELQILKHLKRDAQPTVAIIDQYCEAYKDLFSEVRSYECFKYLHQGIVSPIKRKSLPEIAKVVGVSSPQSLHHFIANSPWSVEELNKIERILSNQKSETRYIREIVYGKRRQITYWQLTTEPETMPENSTSFIMTNLQEKRSKIKKILGNLYGERTWVEYGFRQCKQELGWTDGSIPLFQ